MPMKTQRFAWWEPLKSVSKKWHSEPGGRPRAKMDMVLDALKRNQSKTPNAGQRHVALMQGLAERLGSHAAIQRSFVIDAAKNPRAFCIAAETSPRVV